MARRAPAYKPARSLRDTSILKPLLSDSAVHHEPGHAEWCVQVPQFPKLSFTYFRCFGGRTHHHPTNALAAVVCDCQYEIVKGSAPVLEPPGAPRRAGAILRKHGKSGPAKNTLILHWKCNFGEVGGCSQGGECFFEKPCRSCTVPRKNFLKRCR